jgi:hypothetical protein
MGHRKNRKRDRRGGQGVAEPGFQPGLDSEWLLLHDDMDPFDAFITNSSQLKTEGVKVCGACKEFIEDHEGGRGTCLHPGSGILSPWTDTQACDFYLRSGRR